MADKLSDEQIASELKRFGDTIKVPFKKEKRPIYIKKLNHYYAKENPPVKKGKSANRLNKSTLRPAEFSDDSQDESETVQNSSRLSLSKNKTSNNSFNKDSPRKLRNRTSDNGATFSGGLRSRNSSTGRQKRVSAVQQMELYPEEFSDNDTAEESVYVEEKSIGINTTLNYDDEDDSSDEESLQTNYQTRSNLTNKERQIGSGNISTISPRSFSNHAGFKKSDVTTKATGSEHFISKSILLVLGIFFIILTCGYLYVKKDIFYPREAASSQTDLKTFSFREGKTVYNYTEEEINKGALPVIRKLHDQLASLKGKYELGELTEDQMKISREKLKDLEPWENKSYMVDLCLRLILAHPEWNIKAYDKYGSELSESSTAEEVAELEGLYGDLSLFKRIFLSLYMVLYGLCLLVICIIAGVLGIYCLRWQNKRKEKAQQKVYEMVEKIIEILKDNYEVAERKNDKSYPPYLAVQHIRDQLIPVAQRRQMKALWDDAVKFIETNESRIRVETQIIQGEEFTVWRWLQAMPNGHKMWQGQAFGETSQGSVNSLPYGPTPCLKVRNMFDANMEENVDDWHLDIEESILEKCSDNHGILHIFVDRSSKEGCVYIKCSSCEKAYEAYQALHGWWFDGRLVTVKYLRLEHYHDRFPDSRYKKFPMKPLKTEMPSISRPFKSALEMT